MRATTTSILIAIMATAILAFGVTTAGGVATSAAAPAPIEVAEPTPTAADAPHSHDEPQAQELPPIVEAPAASSLAPTDAAPTTGTPTTSAPAGDTPDPSLSYEETVQVVLTDLDEFWSVNIAHITPGATYASPANGIYAVDGTHACGETHVHVYAHYCNPRANGPDGSFDYVTWSENEMRYVLDRFGDAAVALVLAHEVSHIAQHRAGVLLDGVDRELQADCLAGAWVGAAANGNAGGVTMDESDLAEVEDFMTQVLDGDEGHGTGEQRLAAFDTGFESGVPGCVVDDWPSSTPTAAVTRVIAERNGDEIEITAQVRAVDAEGTRVWVQAWAHDSAGDYIRALDPASASVDSDGDLAAGRMSPVVADEDGLIKVRITMRVDPDQPIDPTQVRVYVGIDDDTTPLDAYTTPVTPAERRS